MSDDQARQEPEVDQTYLPDYLRTVVVAMDGSAESIKALRCK